MINYGTDNITPAESTRHSWETDEQQANRAFQLNLADKNIQVALIENRWGAILRVPLAIVRLPAYMIMSIGYCIAMARGVEVGDQFWDFMQK